MTRRRCAPRWSAAGRTTTTCVRLTAPRVFTPLESGARPRREHAPGRARTGMWVGVIASVAERVRRMATQEGVHTRLSYDGGAGWWAAARAERLSPNPTTDQAVGCGVGGRYGGLGRWRRGRTTVHDACALCSGAIGRLQPLCSRSWPLGFGDPTHGRREAAAEGGGEGGTGWPMRMVGAGTGATATFSIWSRGGRCRQTRSQGLGG